MLRRSILTWINKTKPGYNLTPRTLARSLSRRHTEFLRLYRLLIQLVIGTGLHTRYRIHEIRVLCIRTLEQTLPGEEELEDDCCEAWSEEILDECLSIIYHIVQEYQVHLFHLRTTSIWRTYWHIEHCSRLFIHTSLFTAKTALTLAAAGVFRR